MADNDGLGLQPTVGSYSQLLFAADDAGLENADCYNYKSYFSSSDQCTPKMLCFGDYRNACDFSNTVSETTQTTVQKSGVTCSNSSSTSTANKSTGRANRKRNWPGSELALQGSTAGGGAPAGGQRNSKKSKSETLTSTGNGKKQGKREKLGDRIAALQQLVSPYGKTDTASVLHEAMGYIRFLHEQVQVLCSPYLQRLPSSSSNLLHSHVKSENEQESEEARNELRSRGLCLVPIELTEHIANDNGADFWSPAAMANPNFFPPKH